MLKALDELKQAFADTVTPVSDHEAGVRAARAAILELRQKCPGLKLECVFQGISVDGGSYEGSQVQRSSAELISVLNDAERNELRSFVEAKLAEAEQQLAAA
jgi:hypothetical protein